MLINTAGAKDELYEGRVWFIDFDWVCHENSGARYPFYLSEEVKKSGAKEYGLIEREHQDELFEHFFDQPDSFVSPDFPSDE